MDLTSVSLKFPNLFLCFLFLFPVFISVPLDYNSRSKPSCYSMYGLPLSFPMHNYCDAAASSVLSTLTYWLHYSSIFYTFNQENLYTCIWIAISDLGATKMGSPSCPLHQTLLNFYKTYLSIWKLCTVGPAQYLDG